MEKIIKILCAQFICLIVFISCTVNPSFAQDPIQLGTETEDIILTDDVNLAKAQVEKYPDNPEAHFNLAIALSRTSYVEEAIKELRKTKLLIRKPKNAGTIDRKIDEYKEMLENNPDTSYKNNIRYRLAFSHYLKAYLVSKEIEKQNGNKTKKTSILDSNPFALKNTDPKIKDNLDLSLYYFQEQLKSNPSDLWAKIYYAFILAEQYNETENAKKLWTEVSIAAPNNPAPHLFLGELKIKEGKLKEGLTEVSKAILLRSLGN